MRFDRVCVFCGASDGTDPQYRAAATRLGSSLAAAGVGLVYGAGGVGIMGALSDAALAAGGEVIGVIPEALMEREFGRTDLTELRIVATMHHRKALMHDLSDAFVVLPGGLGTLEEFFEVLTWAQLGLHAKPIVVVDVGGFFGPLLAAIGHAHDAGFLTPADRELVTVVPDVEAALGHLGLPG